MLLEPNPLQRWLMKHFICFVLWKFMQQLPHIEAFVLALKTVLQLLQVPDGGVLQLVSGNVFIFLQPATALQTFSFMSLMLKFCQQTIL